MQFHTSDMILYIYLDATYIVLSNIRSYNNGLKIVIENKVRNAEQMIDKDIYDIYKKSFSAIIKAASMVDDE